MGENKTKILKHNYIIINSIDNSPSEVEVSYSVFMKGNSDNIIKTEKLTTPFVIGGEDVRVVYDSLATIQTSPKRKEPKPEDSFFMMKRNYNPKGADYLSIKNLSGGDLEYCVVGNLPIKYRPIDEIEKWNNLSNKDKIDKSKVIDYKSGGSSMPIYKGTPVLYLFRPDLSPETDIFITRGIIGEGGGIKDVIAEKIILKRPTFGEITLNSPMSLSDVAELYRNEYKYGDILYKDYYTYSHRYGYSLSKYSKDNYFYGKILKGQTFTNIGQVWFINTYGGSMGSNEIDIF